MQRLGRLIADQQGLILHLGGGSGRRDAIARTEESLTVVPVGPHSISLSLDIAYELFEPGHVHLVAGIYLRAGHENPEVPWIGTRDVPLGTQQAARAAEELAQELIDRFPASAARFIELLEDADARAQRARQPRLESTGTNYLFRTEPDAGVIVVYRKGDGSRDGHALAWLEAPLEEIRADGDRLYVRTRQQEGWIERNSRQNWVLSTANALDTTDTTSPARSQQE